VRAGHLSGIRIPFSHPNAGHTFRSHCGYVVERCYWF